MAWFAVIVMCPSERAPPAAMRLLATSATKPSPEQNADYVPGHIIGWLLEVGLLEDAGGLGKVDDLAWTSAGGAEMNNVLVRRVSLPRDRDALANMDLSFTSERVAQVEAVDNQLSLVWIESAKPIEKRFPLQLDGDPWYTGWSRRMGVSGAFWVLDTIPGTHALSSGTSMSIECIAGEALVVCCLRTSSPRLSPSELPQPGLRRQTSTIRVSWRTRD